MEISFLTPVAGVLGASALLTFAAYLSRERRAHRIRQALTLSSPTRRTTALVGSALVLVPLLLGLAASQPVVERTKETEERTDAQAFFVIDTSRSMLASPRSGAPTRIQRARSVAEWLASKLANVPVGLATFNERTLPLAFPTTDSRVIAATLEESLGAERPQQLNAFTIPTRTTALDALAAIPTANYFAPAAKKRLLIVFTDGESAEIEANLLRAFQRRPRVETIFVRFWSESERIYVTGTPEPSYTPDPASGAMLEQVGSLMGGRIFNENQLGPIRATAERILGSGPTSGRRVEGQRLALMPYVTLAVLMPLAFLLWRRNV